MAEIVDAAQDDNRVVKFSDQVQDDTPRPTARVSVNMVLFNRVHQYFDQ